ncbi:dTDP-glucose 4,6-dehydratase [Desulfobacula toluolica]|uniref:dTDP-glucose 4,6-hedydratase n=1 Tax=Desulfobacula toluolica (strain DSM 7467 / Tol2) TaxID=651182 RepID=K0NJK7_DESTT|nr:GDP-mannose 4,6-dehydratase [Desulfobacula toluolica]CCK81686.1 dTDP-glucose 4,6-hedydratase [Desulfobacula toluolica Tol2]
MTKRILVTGGAGFIGSNLVNYLQKKYPSYKIAVYDKLTYAGNIRNLDPLFFNNNSQYTFINACVSDREKLSSAIRNCDIVVHLASESHVSNSLAQADDFVNTNVFGTMVLCEEIVKFPVEKFILISSSEVYGTAEIKPMDETHPLNPASPYAGSKTGQDRIAFSYFYSFDIPLIILRPFNQFGSHQHIEKVIPKFITNLLNDKVIHVENKGTQTRDWLYVEDLCRAIDRTIHYKSNDLFGEAINIGSRREVSILEMAESICEILDKDAEKHIKYGRDRCGQIMSHIASIDKANKLLDWQPMIDIYSGLKKTIAWYHDNPSWYNSLRFPTLKITQTRGGN